MIPKARINAHYDKVRIKEIMINLSKVLVVTCLTFMLLQVGNYACNKWSDKMIQTHTHTEGNDLIECEVWRVEAEFDHYFENGKPTYGSQGFIVKKTCKRTTLWE